jgi:hypothetical protein
VLADIGDAGQVPPDTRKAHIVLSRSGNVGGPEQVRLGLGDRAGLWAALGGEILQQRAAA